MYDLEKRARTPLKFRFPSFETCHWLGGRRLLEEMRDYGDANQRCPGYLAGGARALAAALRTWAHDASVKLPPPASELGLWTELLYLMRSQDTFT